ncbi:MAG TPA: hypothetical protein VMT85_11395 [Thermoanaerobaculia bacterium]|nr:hypothetical protein [Thermoanaerobaculia bacterium]
MNVRRLVMHARFALGFPRYLRHRVTLEEARAEVARRLETRGESFLKLVTRAVFGHRASPYRPLFELASCELGDLEHSVRARGLEGALRELRAAGVYVSYEELKGRVPMVRQGREIPVSPGAFDNPFLRAAYEKGTGGTTGPRTRVMTDLDNLRAKAMMGRLVDEINGTRGLPMAVWRGLLPDNGLGAMISRLPFGTVPERWFTPVAAEQLRGALEYRLATAYVLRASRLFGVPLPDPEPVPVDRALTIARWAADAIARAGGCHLRAYVSLLVRVSVAAQEEGLDLTGAVFGGGGEPPTPAKVAQIERSGARYLPSYHVSELGRVGVSCLAPVEENDHHFCADHLALIQHPTKMPGLDLEVDAFCFTTLLPSAPKIAINVESDDDGVVEERACGCPWEELGLRFHVRSVRSYRKLTGEGMTLIGSDVVRLLEEELPARFGGASTDYQLVEEEDPGGQTRLTLRVSPRVALVDEQEIQQAMLEGLAEGSPAADLARATWSSAGTLRVRREEPVWTAGGKLMPLQLGSRTRAVRS